MTLGRVPACDGFAIVACRDAGMTRMRGLSQDDGGGVGVSVVAGVGAGLTL
jgi:hypothetical protein